MEQLLQQRPFNSGIRVRSFCTAIALIIAVSHAGMAGAAAPQEEEIPAAAIQIARTAQTAQNAGDFEVALGQWEKLIAEFPGCSLAPKAQYNAGVCSYQNGEYQLAIDKLKLAINTLDQSEVQKLGLSYLYTGYCQSRLGKRALEEADTNPEKVEEANILLTTSTETFQTLLTERFTGFEELDQACYFQGQAFALLERWDRAAESFAKMDDCPQNLAFKMDGIRDLGDAYERLNRFDLALETYERFRKTAAEAGGHPLLSDVNYQSGAILLKSAIDAANAEDANQAEGRFASAASMFASASEDTEFSLRDESLSRQAFCESRLGNHLKSAELYEQVSRMEGSPIASASAINAGREFVSAGRDDDAKRMFNSVLESDGERTADAAHWMARQAIDRGEFPVAYDLASQWIGKAEGDALVELKMDRADAAYRISEKVAESGALYLEIADSHSEHELAPTALYNAAFAMLDEKNYDRAVELADRFVKNYKQHPFLPDAKEIKGEASLLGGDAGAAGEVFTELIAVYEDNPKVNQWTLRSGLCEYLAGEYRNTIDLLQPATEVMTDKARRAESLHWIGMSHFKLEEFDNAFAVLTSSRATDDSWSRADETLLMICKSLMATDRDPEARKMAAELLKSYQGTPYTPEATYLLGEIDYRKNNFESAISNFTEVIEKHSDSTFVPRSLYDLAWANLKLKRFEKASEHFSALITRFPGHELAARAAIGRGASRRSGGDPEGAVADFDSFLKGEEITDRARNEALYEKGLALIDLKDWENVRETFQTLLEKDAQSPLIDRYHYEFAWAARSLKNEDAAMEHFDIIADRFPSSPLAPEANFHRGNVLYDAEKFEEAESRYRLCVESNAVKSLREKASYQHAWCAYRKNEFETARERFAAQAGAFPEGALLADARVMISESLFRMDKYQEAYEAYVEARPFVEASETVKARVLWQTLINGGKSANRTGQFNEAIEFVQPVIDSTTTSSALKQEAWLEIGHAKNGLTELDAAIHAWEQAARHPDAAGAEAQCMIGEALFAQKRFDEAITAYKLVFYGYGGLAAGPETRKWQALSVFESAQCNFVQVSEASPQLRTRLVDESIRLFTYLVENYPDENPEMTSRAKAQLETLSALKGG